MWVSVYIVSLLEFGSDVDFLVIEYTYGCSTELNGSCDRMQDEVLGFHGFLANVGRLVGHLKAER
jgi:hypothetical protein